MAFRVPQLVISKNEQRDIGRTPSILDVGTVSQTVRSGNGPYTEKNHSRLEPFSRLSPPLNWYTQ